MWSEGSQAHHKEPVKLLLTEDGKEVESDDAWEQALGRPLDRVWSENYWEGTATTQKMMPGLWMQCPPNDRLHGREGSAAE